MAPDSRTTPALFHAHLFSRFSRPHLYPPVLLCEPPPTPSPSPRVCSHPSSSRAHRRRRHERDQLLPAECTFRPTITPAAQNLYRNCGGERRQPDRERLEKSACLLVTIISHATCSRFLFYTFFSHGFHLRFSKRDQKYSRNRQRSIAAVVPRNPHHSGVR